MELYDDNSGEFTNNNYESGSYIFSESGSGSGSGSGSWINSNVKTKIADEEKYNNGLSIGLFLALSPLIVAGCAIILCFVYINMYIPIKEKIQKLKNFCIQKRKEIDLPIYKNKLNPTFINKLNKNNIDKVKNKKEPLVCSICLDEINLENYKEKKTDLVFLNCSHVFHKDCINSWVETKVKSYTTPECPLCRDTIINIGSVKKNISYSSDSSGYDTDDFYGI